MVRELLAEVDEHDLVETAVLLVSEVVTNALLHAGTRIDVAVSVDRTGVRVEVGDGSLHLPVRRRYSPTAGTGRGMMLLEQMVDEWGVQTRHDGKVVWFRLGTGADDGDDEQTVAGQASGSTRPAGKRQTVAVELRNVPLLLHLAWREHAESLLREYLLISLDGEGDDPIQRHAEATDAIAVLEEHLPSANITTDPDELMSEATEPLVSAASVVMPVPRTSVPHFVTLDDTIEAALALARRGLLLTPTTQPEIRGFRQWVCREVATQAVGAAPIPWTVPDEQLKLPETELPWDATTVSDALTPLVAADHTSRILAVSRSMLDLLGYDDPAQLVGQRLIELIPPRYRQAHVAGFTMYLLTGRDPLLNRPVVVPAQHRGGHEVLVEITVQAQKLPGGQQVFIAGMRPDPS